MVGDVTTVADAGALFDTAGVPVADTVGAVEPVFGVDALTVGEAPAVADDEEDPAAVSVGTALAVAEEETAALCEFDADCADERDASALAVGDTVVDIECVGAGDSLGAGLCEMPVDALAHADTDGDCDADRDRAEDGDTVRDTAEDMLSAFERELETDAVSDCAALPETADAVATNVALVLLLRVPRTSDTRGDADDDAHADEDADIRGDGVSVESADAVRDVTGELLSRTLKVDARVGLGGALSVSRLVGM